MRRSRTIALTAVATALLAASAQARVVSERGEIFQFPFDRIAMADPVEAERTYDHLARRIRHHCRRSHEQGVRARKAEKSCEAALMGECEKQMPTELRAVHDARRAKLASRI